MNPQLKNIKIHTDAVMNDMPSNGEYNPQTKTITIHADELKYLNSILNHEIQHVIQREEGFAHGGTPEQVERDFNAAKAEWKARSYAFELEEKAKEMGGEYNQSAVEKALIQEYKDMDMPEFIPDKETRIKGFNYFARGYADRSMDDAIKRFRLDRFQRTDFDSYQEYRKLAGETEARNVQKRMDMTPEERRASLASETEDVSRGDQIVMNNGGTSYSIVKDPETIKKLDKEDTVKVYRAMQVGEDGKLYPPMAAKVKGKFVQPIELGKWEQADERPELADDKGMFTLNKGNGKSLKAAYNPYLHTSRTPLNDQFSEAQNRPNIVTVEVEVPKSELTSGYKADKAKDAVGEVEWKAGIIQGQLTGKRKVVLSRWDKPVRIVPDSEVADVIVNDMFKGKNITMPTNVVTPSLRKELEKRGVPFVETDNRGRIVGGENDGVHYSKVYGKKANVKHRLGEKGAERADHADEVSTRLDNLTVAREMEDVSREDQIFLYGGENANDESVSLFDDGEREELDRVNERFNEQLATLTEKNADKVVLSLGNPSRVLRLAGVKYMPMKLYGNKVMKKMRKHGFALEELRDLPRAVADPIAVFNNYGEDGNRSILTELRTKQGNFLVSVNIGKDADVDFNIVRSVFGKGDNNIVDWINKGLATYINKKKALTFLSHQSAPIAATAANAELSSAAKVVENFENPKVSDENVADDGIKLSLGDGDSREREQMDEAKMVERVKATGESLGGAEVHVYTSFVDVPEEYKKEVKKGARGWYDPETHTVHVYLPNCASGDEAQRTVFHESRLSFLFV